MDERIAALKEHFPEFGWLARIDEEQGFFVHLHSGPIKTASGALAGFKRSYRAWNADLNAAWDDALAQLKAVAN